MRLNKDNKLSNKNTSLIWNSLREEFKKKNSTLRGYGMSIYLLRRVNLFHSVSYFSSLPFKVIINLSSKSMKLINRFLSWIIFDGDKLAADKYGFNNFTIDMYEPNEVKEFLEKYSKKKIGFSHNTFKLYSYLKRLDSYVDLPDELSIFEIGAGMFNFGHLISLQLQKFNYVVCDLPEIIISANNEITEKYKRTCGGDYEVFLPDEIDKYEISSSQRKILFITPEQLNKNVLGKKRRFDLFLNHDSFSEMDISTVNIYLNFVEKLMKKGSIVNIINRHNRAQAKTYEEFKQLKLKNITCFENYNLNFCDTVVKTEDTFRQSIKQTQERPNVFYIGRVK